MTNPWRSIVSRSLLLVVCVACACDDSDGASEGSTASSSTSGGSTTGEGSTDTGIATTPPGSTDTGIATTPPETEGSSSGGSGSSEGTTGGEGIGVQVSYSFTAEVAGVPFDCKSAGATWVDVTVMNTADPEDQSFDLLDLDCDDQSITVGPLPIGSYTVSVVAWDQALWVGDVPLELDGTERQVELLVPLTEVPAE